MSNDYEGRLKAWRKVGQVYRDLVSKHGLLKLGACHISELRTYRKPPEAVKTVMNITLLVLGYGKDDASDWRFATSVLLQIGPNGLLQQITHKDPRLISKTTIETVKNLMQEVQFEHIVGVSYALVALHVWATAMIAEAITHHRS